MIRLSIVVVAVIALSSALVSARYEDTCRQPRSACQASAVAVAKVTSVGGKCSVSSQANAFCAAFESDIRRCFVADSSFYGVDNCRPRDINVDITCWSDLVASAYASGFVRADCDGKSIGCGLASATAEAEARSIGCFVVQSLLKVAQSLNTDTTQCQIELANVVDAVASAAASARASACSSGGTPGIDVAIDFDAEVQRVIGKAFGTCWTYCSAGGK